MLDFDYKFSETDFTQEKKSFLSNNNDRHSSLVLAAALSQKGRISYSSSIKDMKYALLRPVTCILNIKESIFS